MKKELSDNTIIMAIHIIMTSLKSLTDKNGGKVGKYEGLYECYQYFNKINKHSECDRDRRKSPSGYFTHAAENKDQHNKAGDHNMTSNHICEKTYHKGYRLDKDAC